MSEIVYSESGSGFPVIFLHGYGESSELWKLFHAHLSTRYRTIAPDLPGFGKSPLFKKEFSLEEVADKVSLWMEEIGVKECIMIGHSMGGYITLAFARKYPEKIRALGLFHSSVFADTPEKKENRLKTVEFIRRNGGSVFMENFVPNLFYEENRARLKDIMQRQVEVGKGISDDTLAAYMTAMAYRADSAGFIRGFDKPVLMIIGENDRSVPLEKSKEQADLLRHPHVHFLEKTGHMGMFERERETLMFVEAFVEKASLI